MSDVTAIVNELRRGHDPDSENHIQLRAAELIETLASRLQGEVRDRLATQDALNKTISDERTHYAKLVNDAEDRANALSLRLDSLYRVSVRVANDLAEASKYRGQLNMDSSTAAKLADDLRKAGVVERHIHNWNADGRCECGETDTFAPAAARLAVERQCIHPRWEPRAGNMGDEYCAKCGIVRDEEGVPTGEYERV